MRIKIEGINDNLSCKYIEGESFFCAMIINSDLYIYCLKYHFNDVDSIYDSLSFNTNPLSSIYESVSNFGLYDTDINNIKLLCGEQSQSFQCKFIEIFVNNDMNSFTFRLKGDNNIVFNSINLYIEKNCYFIRFYSDYLFCCAILNFIECYKINPESKVVIKRFQISIPGENSYLTIKNNNDEYVTLFFMNNYNDKNSIFEYYIYIPECIDKNYEILNSLNENKSEEESEKLINLFKAKTNTYYFELKNQSTEFGYFKLNEFRVTERM